MHALRTRPGRTSTLGMRAKLAPRATGGHIDPSRVIDLDAVRRKSRAERDARREESARRRTERARARAERITERTDDSLRDERESLERAWDDAPLGAEKRAALAALEAFLLRHGYKSASEPTIEYVGAAGAVASAMGGAD